MTALHAVVLGLVQGATEFLPVSSSGHLILVPMLLGWPDQGLTFDAAVHLGTVLALLCYFAGELRRLAAGILAILAADLLGETVLYFGPHAGHRASWREACAAVRDRAREGDVIASTQAPLVEFYLNPSSTRLRDPSRSFWLSAYTLGEFERGAQRRERIWYIVNDADLDDWPAAERTRFRDRLRERARLVAEWPRRIVTDDLGVKVYREDP